MKRIFSVLMLSMCFLQGFSQKDTLSPEKRTRRSIERAINNNTQQIKASDFKNALQDLTNLAVGRTPYVTMRELRQGKADTASAVYVNEAGRSGVFRYSKGDASSQDDSVMVIKVGSRRYVRDYDGYVNVKWFGAKGDGVTDDTEAIQRAINFLNPDAVKVYKFSNSLKTGGTVYIPGGRFKITKTLWLTNGVTLKGNGGISPYSNRFTNNSEATILLGIFDHNAFMIQTQSWRTQNISEVNVKPGRVAYNEVTHWRQSDHLKLTLTSGAAVEDMLLLNGGSKTWGGIRFCSSTYGMIRNVEVSQSDIGIMLDCALFNNIERVHIDAKIAGIIVSESSISNKISHVYLNVISPTTFAQRGISAPEYYNVNRYNALKKGVTFNSDTTRVAIFAHGCDGLELDNITFEAWPIGLVGKSSTIDSRLMYFENISNTAIVLAGGSYTFSTNTFIFCKTHYGIDDFVNLNEVQTKTALPHPAFKEYKGYDPANWSQTPNVNMRRKGDMLTNRGGQLLGTLGLPSAENNSTYNAIGKGNGIGASYDVNNFVLQGNYGMGMNDLNGKTNGFYNFRSGVWDVKGGYYVNGKPLKAAASPDNAKSVGTTYSQQEVQAILTELRDLKAKLKAANLLE